MKEGDGGKGKKPVGIFDGSFLSDDLFFFLSFFVLPVSGFVSILCLYIFLGEFEKILSISP
jgi:hypothetical protein